MYLSGYSISAPSLSSILNDIYVIVYQIDMDVIIEYQLVKSEVIHSEQSMYCLIQLSLMQSHDFPYPFIPITDE